LIVTTEHPHFGTCAASAVPCASETAPPPARRAPQRNEHADDILRGLLHYGDQKIGELSAAGAFG